MEAPIIVLGLGNPGPLYRWTRHNVGFRVVDRLARRGGVEFAEHPEIGRLARVAGLVRGGRQLILARPRTYMNRSGRAASALCRAYAVEPARVLAVYDDADLELGRLRLRPAGGTGGHNGIRSMIEALQTDEFPRVRLGIRGGGRGDRELADYVLAPFAAEEVALIEALVDMAADAVEAVLEDGMTTAMNRYNGCKAAAPEDGAPQEG